MAARIQVHIFDYEKNFECRQPDYQHYWGCGLIEPRVYILLRQLKIFYRENIIIHLLHHRAVMAFGKYLRQLKAFRNLIHRNNPADPLLVSEASLHYWVKVNRIVDEISRWPGPEHHNQVDYDQISLNPGRFWTPC